MKGLSRESRLLIDAARDGDEPSAADRRRVRTALARKLAVGAAAGVAAATATHAAAGGVAAAGTGGAAGTATAVAGVGVAGSAAGTASITAGAIATGFGAKLFVAVALVGAVSAGTVGYARHEATKGAERAAVAQQVAAQSALAKSVPAIPPAGKPPTRPPPESGGGESEAQSEAPSVVSPPKETRVLLPPIRGEVGRGASSSASAVVAARIAPIVPSAPAPSSLDDEIALLQGANAALRQKDGARALRLLDEHARRFPNGALGEETEAARVFALCQMGRTGEARDVAGRFLREHPRSPLAPRVSRACDSDPSTF